MKTKKVPGQQQAGPHGPGDVAQRVLGLAAECGGALEADEREHADDDGQAQAVQVHALQGELVGVDAESVLEEHDERQHHDAGHRQSIDDQGQQRRDPDVLEGDVPADGCADQEEEDRRHGDVYADCGDELLCEDGEPGQAGDTDEEVRPDQGPARQPDVGPSPRPVYAYMDPGEADRRENGLRHATTNSSMTVPNR